MRQSTRKWRRNDTKMYLLVVQWPTYDKIFLILMCYNPPKGTSLSDSMFELQHMNTSQRVLSQYSTVVLTVVRVMIAKYRKSGIWGYRSSLTPEPVELK